VSAQRHIRFFFYVHRQRGSQSWYGQFSDAGPSAAAFAPGRQRRWEGWDDAGGPPRKLAALYAEYPAGDETHTEITERSTDISVTASHPMRVTFDLEGNGYSKYGEFIEPPATPTWWIVPYEYRSREPATKKKNRGQKEWSYSRAA